MADHGAYLEALNVALVAAFPDIEELKQLIRDRITPERDLGHSDRDPL